MPLIPLAIAGGFGLLSGMFAGAQVDDALEGGKNSMSLLNIAILAVIAYYGLKLFKKIK